MSGAHKILRSKARLLGIERLTQGDSDCLCVYYSAAMLLGAHRPSKRNLFHSYKTDPLLKAALRKGETPQSRLAKWFYDGTNVKKMRRILDASCADGGPSFQYKAHYVKPSLFKVIQGHIDGQRPVLLAWDTAELGVHAVLVKGYEVWRPNGKKRTEWLLLHDPSTGEDKVEFRQLMLLRTGVFELIWADPATDVRLPSLERLTWRVGTPQDLEYELSPEVKPGRDARSTARRGK